MGRIGNIVNRKNKQDARRAKMFSKLSRYIMVAVREGGPDPEYNASLLSAIEKAKAANMPNDNIDRAIKKGVGDIEGAAFTEITYEGYGPNGLAILVECLTDNLNRTAANVRSHFTKGKGNLGTNGCVSYMFDRLGVLVVDKTNNIDEETIMMESIDAGADDFVTEKTHYEIYTDVDNFSNVREALKKSGYVFSMAELRYVPQTFVKLDNEEDIKNANRLIDLLEEDDDCQNIYTNWEE